jgi:hypothetical protein
MAEKSGWSRSDTISVGAAFVAGLSLLLQYLDRNTPYKVQAYIDRTEAASKIVDGVEQLIHARQLAMISVEWNIYEPSHAKNIPLDQMNAAAREATPVVNALGNYKGALQNNLRFFEDVQTLDALGDLDAEVDRAVKCFTDVASARHQFNPQQLAAFREIIAVSCEGANNPTSLDALKTAEARAMSAMDAERARGRTDKS